jgi:hypothetical protein
MPECYQGIGISMLYPENWKLEEEPMNQAVSLESPEGAFMVITRLGAEQNPTAALSDALSTMNAEYEEIEAEPLAREIASITLIGQMLRFVYLDLIIASQVLTVSAPTDHYLIQIQAEDRQYDKLQPVFDALLTSMCQSLGKASPE